MAIAKVIYKSSAEATPEVWMDTTDKTAAAGNMLSGTTALKNDGTTATGNIATKTSANLSASGATVTAPAGYYASDASKSVASGTEGTPTATKGTVSNHSVTVTPSVTNAAGYISGGTHNGTAATVSASELVSGTKSITANGTNIDVTNYAAVDVAVSGGSANIQPLSVTTNGTYTASGNVDGYSPVTVNVSGGGGGVAEKLVNFIDYDGTILYSYTKSEFNSLSSLPSNPDHGGDDIPLTSQGWNWTKQQISAQLTAQPNDPIYVGQMYITKDEKTYLVIELNEGRLSPYLGLAINGTVTVDWGDNSSTNTVTGTSLTTIVNTLHQYPSAGRYSIAISVSSGEFSLYGVNAYGIINKKTGTTNENRVYSNALLAVRVGKSVTIGSRAFNNCNNLVSITFTNAITSIGSYAFAYCYSLQNVTLPSSVTTIGAYAFDHCSGLKAFTMPNSITSIGLYMFNVCYTLKNVIISSDITNIPGYMFYNCYGLINITIPSDVTTLETYAFANAQGLSKVRFLASNPPSISNSNTFAYLPTDCVISVPVGKLSDYTGATNYPSSSTYTYIEE